MIEAQMISALNQGIARLSASIRENEAKIKRLETVKASIETEQEEIIDNKKNIFQPEFSLNSWAGKHATEHSNVRDSLDTSNTNIANQQVEDRLDTIEEKITALRSENQSLMNSISSKRNAITQLKNK
ncbi:DUF5082 domain-containing protein [Bacillus aquiflavi]|uniref:YwqH-like family protein n=1 Tax=Bacillus aquiflavi TaxID=2672567 RepID=UPI001CA8379D|nr:DUF5082 family protein [Bacillus aquiflavi]UAC48913.1 DUF5082 domain-containing protein [Bacillus aquiflavi]